MRLHTFFSLMVFFCVLVLFSACKSSTSTQKGSITGVIHLSGETDHSGIMVSIYPAGLVPEKVTSINNDYPGLAFPVTDQVFFDHRSYSPVVTTTTNHEGIFMCSELPYDNYIIAYSKVGWGYNYLFDILLNQSELNINTNDEIKLFQEQQIPSYIDGAYTFESGKSYVTETNVIFGETAQIVMQSNTRILLGQNVKISSYGTLNLPSGENWAQITSLTGSYTGDDITTSLAEGLLILGGGGSLHNIAFSFLTNALKIASSNVSINNMSFRSCVFGLTANSTQDIFVSRSLFINNNDNGGCASYMYNVTRTSNNQCIYYNNYAAIKHEIVKDATIENIAFIGNNRGFANLWESTAVFQHNFIDSSGVGVENSGLSNLEIYYNSITASTCVQTYHTNNWYNTINYGWTKASNNNFLPLVYAVESRARYSYPDGPYPLDFKNNYWGTTDTGTIDSFIIDFFDLGLVVGSGVSSIVNYTPYKQNPIPIAGIQIR